MKKLFGIFAIVMIGSFALPACSSTDSLDEVVNAGSQKASLNTDDEKPKMPIPGGGN